MLKNALRLPLVTSLMVLTAWTSLPAEEPAVVTHPDGSVVRKFSAVPAPGIHPRVFISPEDLPALRRDAKESPARIKHYERLRKSFSDKLDNPKAAEGRVLAVMAEGGTPTDAQFAAAGDLGSQLHLAGIDALIREDAVRGALLGKTLAAYGTYQLKNWVRKPDIVGLHNSFDAGFAMAYDYLAPWMDEAQRAPARGFIAKMADGIHIFTWDWPAHMRMWNWAGLHVHQGWSSLAIEGEEGWKPTLWNEAKTVVRDFCRYNIHPSGALTEDITYFSFAMRGVGPGLVAMSRRGEDDVLAEGSNYTKLKYHLINQLQPWGGPNFMSHQDGGGAGFYAMWTFHKYFYPLDPIVDTTYRNRVGDDYMTSVDGNDGDTRTWATVLFSTEVSATAHSPADLKLPNTYFCPTRSYLIARSGWDADALKLDFEAKTDYPTVGHNHADANNFTFAALGREWATEVGYHGAAGHLHNNVLIDGRSESGWPTPGGHWVDLVDGAQATIGVADARHAYSWQWANSGYGTENRPPSDLVKWERETLPEVEAFIHDQVVSGKGRQTIFEHYGPVIRSVWNPVEKAFRAAALVRGPRPYALIVDDIRKDDAIHLYEWAMQMPEDVEVIKHGGRFVVLGAKDLPADPKAGKDAKPQPDKRRLLVQVVDVDLPTDRDALAITLESTSLANGAFDGGKGRKRLVIPARSVEPRFKILLYPHREGDPLPDVTWNEDRTACDITIGDQRDRLELAAAAAGRTALRLSRGATVLATVAAAPSAPVLTSCQQVFTEQGRIEFALPGPGQEIRYTTDGSEPTATSTFYDGPITTSATTTLKAVTVARRWKFGDQRISAITTTTVTKEAPRSAVVAPAGLAPGLAATVYAGFWNQLPDFTALTPVATATVDHAVLPPGTPTKGFGVVLKGFLRVPAPGVYRLAVTSDDGSRLWIGDRLVVDNDGQHVVQTRSGEIALAAGLHPVTIQACDSAIVLGTGKGDGSWAFRVAWAPQGADLAEIPPEAWSAVTAAQAETPVPNVAAVAGVATTGGLDHATYDRTGLTPFDLAEATPLVRDLREYVETPDASPNLVHAYRGYLAVPHAGIHAFRLDGGVVGEVRVGQVVVFRSGVPGQDVTQPVRLEAGVVPYQVLLAKGSGLVRWQGPGQDWQSVAAEDVLRDLRPLVTVADRQPGRSTYEIPGPTAIVLTAPVAGTTISYSLDGAEPTQAYDQPLTIGSTTTLRTCLMAGGKPVGMESKVSFLLQAVAEEGLVGCWSPAHMNGTTVLNQVTAHAAGHLILPAGTPVAQDPVQGPVLVLDHAARVTLSPTGILANELTLSFRLRPEGGGTLAHHGYAHFGIFMDVDQGGAVNASGGGEWRAAKTKDGLVNDGAWHQVTATYGGTPIRVIETWIDGVKQASGRSKAPCLTDKLDLFGGFTGQVAEIRIYNRILTGAEIAGLTRGLWAVKP